MKAIILAAGYATRLYPLTKDRPKALLPIGSSTIIDRLAEQIATIDVVDEVHIVSNHKFYSQFCGWAETVKASYPRLKFFVWDDGTDTNDTRLGALGDIKFVLDNAAIDDDLLVLASDTYFSFPLLNFYLDFKRHGRDLLLAHKEGSETDCRRFAIAVLDANGRVLDLEEKPESPKSRTAIYAAYIYRADTLPLLDRYLNDGNNPDAPGHFPVWLYTQRDVRAYVFGGECVDIGTLDAYHVACAAEIM